MERGEENATSGVEQSHALAAAERIRAKARNLKAGGFDWDACKADRACGPAVILPVRLTSSTSR